MVNKSQEIAIAHNQGPALVLAGPGTGKTTVITRRVDRMVREGIEESSILVVTFTRMAAGEMRERYEKISVNDKNQVTFGTFHSVFLNIVNSVGAFGRLQIVSEKEKTMILSEIVIENKIRNFELREFVDNIATEISKAKSVCPESFKSGYCRQEDFEFIFDSYNKELRARNLIDYDDIVIMCNDLLSNNTGVRKKWQNKYKYIMVDEFQDINAIQYDTLKFLVGEQQNIFVVGDDDQSIYGFRGASPTLMFKFKDDFAKCRIIRLDINYRSKKEIYDNAHNLICHNRKRYSKNVDSHRGAGGKIHFIETKNQIEEYEFIANQIKNMTKKGVSYKDIAILLRNNTDIAKLENYLSGCGMSVATKCKKTIFDHPIARDIIMYLKAALSDLNQPIYKNASLANIINKPERLISRHMIIESESNIYELITRYESNDKIQKNITKLKNDLNMIKRMPPFAAVNYIELGVGLEKYVECEYKKYKLKDLGSIKDVFLKMKNEALRFKTNDEFIKFAEQSRNFNKEETVSSNRTKNNNEINGVNIMTIHSSKGLEFRHVFIPDVCQGILPETRALREGDVEEERRLFYVGMTRAADSLYIINCTDYMGKKMVRSQFVDEFKNAQRYCHEMSRSDNGQLMFDN
ncbi:MAG: ATP-dependent helicase [Lachnospiraceae bacterium]|nr:ATP-dependent helicase [Lachnospiraceae bacterium]